MKPKQLKNIVAQIKRHKDEIGKHRDALRVILEDLQSIDDSMEQAGYELETAIDTLSQYV